MLFLNFGLKETVYWKFFNPITPLPRPDHACLRLIQVYTTLHDHFIEIEGFVQKLSHTNIYYTKVISILITFRRVQQQTTYSLMLLLRRMSKISYLICLNNILGYYWARFLWENNNNQIVLEIH